MNAQVSTLLTPLESEKKLELGKQYCAARNPFRIHSPGPKNRIRIM